jgi:hypothetical protein
MFYHLIGGKTRLKIVDFWLYVLLKSTVVSIKIAYVN